MQAFQAVLFLAAAGMLLGQAPTDAVTPYSPAPSAPNVVYTATGTFESTPISGPDTLKQAGQPFSISIVANEALKPSKHNQTSAQYTSLQMTGTVYSGLIPGVPLPISISMTTVELQVGAPGQPDEYVISYPLTVLGLPVKLSAKATLPPGTLTTRAIDPFTTPVTLSPTDVRVSYTYGNPPTPTVLGIASGTLGTQLQSGSSMR